MVLDRKIKKKFIRIFNCSVTLILTGAQNCSIFVFLTFCGHFRVNSRLMSKISQNGKLDDIWSCIMEQLDIRPVTCYMYYFDAEDLVSPL